MHPEAVCVFTIALMRVWVIIVMRIAIDDLMTACGGVNEKAGAEDVVNVKEFENIVVSIAAHTYSGVGAGVHWNITHFETFKVQPGTGNIKPLGVI